MKKTTEKTSKKAAGVTKAEVKAAIEAKGAERICTYCKKLHVQDAACLDCMSDNMKNFESAV